MARTSAGAVQKVLGKDYDTANAPSLSGYIETAGAVVDDIVAHGVDLDPVVTVTTARAELLERWLAAFYYALSDKPYASRSTLSASASFQGQTGKGFEANFYGQTAKNLDPTGYLDAQDSGGGNVGGGWLGKPPSEQTDYVDRD